MSRETWEILQQMEPKDVELQLALQCAPLIAGLKPSNLFNIPCEGVCQVRELIRDTGISMYVLFQPAEKRLCSYTEEKVWKNTWNRNR